MGKFYCIKCGADISDLPAKCPNCGHGYTYEVERGRRKWVFRPTLLFWFLLPWILLFVLPNLF